MWDLQEDEDNSQEPWWWSPQCISGVQEGGQLSPQLLCLKNLKDIKGHGRELFTKRFADIWDTSTLQKKGGSLFLLPRPPIFILRSFECFEKITATKKLHYWYLMASLMMIMVTSDDNDFECLYLKMSLLLFVSMGSSMAWEKKSLLVKPCLRSRGPDSDAIWLCRSFFYWWALDRGRLEQSLWRGMR